MRTLVEDWRTLVTLYYVKIEEKVLTLQPCSINENRNEDKTGIGKRDGA